MHQVVWPSYQFQHRTAVYWESSMEEMFCELLSLPQVHKNTFAIQLANIICKIFITLQLKTHYLSFLSQHKQLFMWILLESRHSYMGTCYTYYRQSLGYMSYRKDRYDVAVYKSERVTSWPCSLLYYVQSYLSRPVFVQRYQLEMILCAISDGTYHL